MARDIARPRIRRIEHPARVIAFVAVTVLIAAAAFIAGFWVRSPDAAVIDAQDARIPVWAAVEQRVVSDDVRLQGQVSGLEERAVEVGAPEGADRPIVTSATAQAGPLSNGALLGTVSGRPVFVVSTDIPLYRPLLAGTRGADVAGLQRALGTKESGIVDTTLLARIKEMYRQAAVLPPGSPDDTMIDPREVYTISTRFGSVALVHVAGVGEEVTPERPFATIGVGTPHVTVRASVVESERMATGQDATLQSGDTTEKGKITDIGAFQETATESGRPPGKDVTVQLPSGTKLASGSNVSILFGAEAKPSSAVPTVAVKSDAGGDFVLKRGAGGETERADVKVERNANGWTAIESDELSNRDRVLVSR